MKNARLVGVFVLLTLFGCSGDSDPQGQPETTYVSFTVEQATTGENWHLKTRGFEVEEIDSAPGRTIEGLPEECGIFPTAQPPQTDAEVKIVAGDRDWTVPISRDSRIGLRDLPLSLVEFEFLAAGSRPSLSVTDSFSDPPERPQTRVEAVWDSETLVISASSNRPVGLRLDLPQEELRCSGLEDAEFELALEDLPSDFDPIDSELTYFIEERSELEFADGSTGELLLRSAVNDVISIDCFALDPETCQEMNYVSRDDQPARCQGVGGYSLWNDAEGCYDGGGFLCVHYGSVNSEIYGWAVTLPDGSCAQMGRSISPLPPGWGSQNRCGCHVEQGVYDCMFDEGLVCE